MTYIHTHMCILAKCCLWLAQNYKYIFTYPSAQAGCVAQSSGAAEYTNCISAGGKNPPNSIFDMTLNNLLVRLQ